MYIYLWCKTLELVKMDLRNSTSLPRFKKEYKNKNKNKNKKFIVDPNTN